MKRIKFQLFLLLLIGILSNAHAQFQRMGIKKGTSLTIPANSKSNVKAYCMDYTLDPPKSGIFYQKVLSDPSSARVQFVGESPMSLQLALEMGNIVIEGVNLSFDTHRELIGKPFNLSTMTEEEVDEYNLDKALWDLLMQSGLIEQEGDSSRMQLINNSDKEVSILFNDNSLIAVDKDVKIGSVEASWLDDRSQSDLWFLGNVENQKKLKELGFYKGKIDGNISSKDNEDIQKAIQEFQIQIGHEPTGNIDPETDFLLLEAYGKKIEENKRLQEYLRTNGDFEGEINGIIKKKAIKSLESFKLKHGLDPYDIEMKVWEDKVHMEFKNQHDFLNYYKKLDEECNPEFCLSDDMSISLTSSCFPGSLSVSVSSGLHLTIEAGGISYDITLLEGDDMSQNNNGCGLSKGACFSRALEKDYSLQCEEDNTAIEVYATRATLSAGNLNVSLFK